MSLTLIAQAEPPQPQPAPVVEPTSEAVSTSPLPPPGGAAQPETAGLAPVADSPKESASGKPITPEALPLVPGAALPPEQLTAGMGLPLSPPQDMSIKDMFLNADPVVQGVMILLFLASVATWVVIFEKAFILRRASRQIMLFKRAAAREDQPIVSDDYSELTRAVVKAGIEESGFPAEDESKSEYRERIERTMRTELAGLMDRLGYRTLFLASVGSVSPFVGLFGTVWGIMHSFIGIAASGETTLAVVAPGIAEALFATAMGLVAAIPAVIAYNKITGTLKKITKEALSGIGRLGNRLARLNYRRAWSE